LPGSFLPILLQRNNVDVQKLQKEGKRQLAQTSKWHYLKGTTRALAWARMNCKEEQKMHFYWKLHMHMLVFSAFFVQQLYKWLMKAFVWCCQQSEKPTALWVTASY
jgi:hypothetical protein